jgi:predicted NBD/HSP70 family sugar kinase
LTSSDTPSCDASVRDALIKHQLRLHETEAAPQQHAELVLGLLAHYGPLTQADLIKKSCVGRSAVGQGLRWLKERDLVAGEERHPWGLEGSAATIVGVDFGRRHIRVLIANLAMQKIGSANESMPVLESGRDAIEQAASMVASLLRDHGIPRENVLGVGVALCGPWRQDQRIAPASVLTGWEGIRPEKELSDRLRIPVIADNDANLGALGEIACGAARDCSNIVYLLPIGGVGCGLIVNGMIYRGATGLSGEVGHTIIDRMAKGEDDERCPICHQRCLDDLFVGHKFLRQLPERDRSELEAYEADRSAAGTPLSGDERLAYVVRRALEGRQSFRTAIVDATKNLGLILANLCMVFDPELIVVGGHLMARAANIVLEPLRADFRERYLLHNLPEAAQVTILPAARGEESQVYGAAALVLREPNAELIARRRDVLRLARRPRRAAG